MSFARRSAEKWFMKWWSRFQCTTSWSSSTCRKDPKNYSLAAWRIRSTDAQWTRSWKVISSWCVMLGGWMSLLIRDAKADQLDSINHSAWDVSFYGDFPPDYLLLRRESVLWLHKLHKLLSFHALMLIDLIGFHCSPLRRFPQLSPRLSVTSSNAARFSSRQIRLWTCQCRSSLTWFPDFLSAQHRRRTKVDLGRLIHVIRQQQLWRLDGHNNRRTTETASAPRRTKSSAVWSLWQSLRQTQSPQAAHENAYWWVQESKIRSRLSDELELIDIPPCN